MEKMGKMGKMVRMELTVRMVWTESMVKTVWMGIRAQLALKESRVPMA